MICRTSLDKEHYTFYYSNHRNEKGYEMIVLIGLITKYNQHLIKRASPH